MTRSLASLLAWSALAFATAYAIPARPLYEPPEAPQPPPLVTVHNTTWEGRLYMDGERVSFHADGTLTYSHGPNINGSASPGSWRMAGNQLFFDINNFSEYQATVTGDLIQGTGINKSGQKCTPTLRRVPYQGKPGVRP